MRILISVNGMLLIFLFISMIFNNMATAEIISGETLLTETENLPYYLKDRGEGVSSSMFGTYVKKGQLYIYPFNEYYTGCRCNKRLSVQCN